MADTVAAWGGLDIQIVSQDVVDAVEAVKSFLELINEALSIALAVGEVIKAFVTSNLNLARALANQLIAALRNLIQDLFSLGLYINLGDNDLVKRGVSNLKGGYPAYERRMLTRLNDRNDPNRPNFTESSTVLALFYYIGVDVSFVDGLLDTKKFAPLMQFLRAFSSLFGFSLGGPNPGLPVATNLRVEYGSPTNTSSQDFTTALSSLMGKSTIEVLWNVAPAPGGSDQDPNPTIPPCAFIVEVSCYPTGFQVGWIAPTTSGTGGPNGTGSDGAQSYTTGQYQTADTGRPLVVFGGVDSLHLTSDLLWPDGFTTGSTLPPGNHPAFFRDASNPEVIRKAFGKDETYGTYYNQRSFYIGSDSTIVQLVSGGNYSLKLDLDDLPLYCPIVNGELDVTKAARPAAVYVRVIPVTDNVTDTNFNQEASKWTPKARTSDDSTLTHIGTSGTGTPGDADFGTPSSVLEVAIPSAEQDLYGRALQTAIAILVLSRSDLVPPDPVTTNEPPSTDPTYPTYTPHGLESNATEVFRWMGISNPEEYFSTRGTSPQSFVQDLYPRIVSQADRYIATQGMLPASVLTSLQDTLHALVDWKWSKANVAGATGNSALRMTILESLNQTDPTKMVLARNRYSTRDYWSTSSPASVLVPLAGKWRTGTFGVQNRSSKDSAVVVGPSNGAQPGYWYARDLIPQDMYDKARRVLAITSDQSALQRSAQGSWKTVRVFSARSPTGTMLGVLTKVEGFLNTALTGLQNVADGILRVIAFLEQRVREIQELIKRIETYLDIPFQISFPSAKVLLLITNGTAGVITGLTGATDKPSEGRSGYAGGGVIVAGSAPAILVELLSAGLSSATGG